MMQQDGDRVRDAHFRGLHISHHPKREEQSENEDGTQQFKALSATKLAQLCLLAQCPAGQSPGCPPKVSTVLFGLSIMAKKPCVPPCNQQALKCYKQSLLGLKKLLNSTSDTWWDSLGCPVQGQELNNPCGSHLAEDIL